LIQTLQNTTSSAIVNSFKCAQWFAVQTRSRFEKVVRAELALSGIEHYLPTLEQARQWKDRQKTVELPLFAGYIFVRCREESDRMRVLRSNGVVRILGAGGASSPIPDGEIDSLRQMLLSG
jgi:transcription antitermination factor NusG